MRKVACYVDGFNLYHAIHDLGRPHLKWLNLRSLAESLLYPNERLVAVKYFSAYATWRPDAYRRHRAYIRALRHAGVEINLAHFKHKDRKCYRCNHQWTDHEEKETDVRIALRMMEDAMDGLFDRAILISGDSDLVPVVETVLRRWPDKRILVAVPPGRFRTSRDLCGSASQRYELRPGRLEASLLPARILDGSGRVVVERPPEYAVPGRR